MGSLLRRSRLLLVWTSVVLTFSVLPAAAAGSGSATLSPSAFAAQLAAAQQLVAACAATATSCNPAAVPTDALVNRDPAAGGSFHADWQWLREALDTAKRASQPDRLAAMRASAGRLGEIATESGASSEPVDSTSFARAKDAARTVLARNEFRAATAGPTWLDRQKARLQDWLLRLFMGASLVGANNPWLAPFLEWSLFLLAAAGLVFSVRRSLARQALRIALGGNVAQAQRGQREATNWADLAAARATTGDWREAVHCLYWAAIVLLESRRAWRPNPTRTPREYPPLLRPGSEVQRSLQDLTRRFERVWYGKAQATEQIYLQAQLSFTAIQHADLQRLTGERDPSARSRTPVGAA